MNPSSSCLFLNGHARPVPHILVIPRQPIKQRRLSTIWISCQYNAEFLFSFLHASFLPD